jgi:hypothetical protein
VQSTAEQGMHNGQSKWPNIFDKHNNHFMSSINPKPQQDSAEEAINEHITFTTPVNL